MFFGLGCCFVIVFFSEGFRKRVFLFSLRGYNFLFLFTGGIRVEIRFRLIGYLYGLVVCRNDANEGFFSGSLC